MLRDQLKKDLVTAMKAGETTKRSVLGMVLTAVKNRELDKRSRLSKEGIPAEELEAKSALTDEETLEVIASEVKKRKESIEQFKAGGREELAANEQAEIDALMGYLPEQLGEDQVRAEVQATIAELGASDVKDVGKVMQAAMAKLKGKADGSLVSKIARELLTK